MLSTVAGVMILWWLCYVPMVHASHLFSVFGLFYHLTACYNSSQLHLFSCEDLISIRWSTHVLLHMVRTHRRGEKELDPALIFPVVFPSWFRLFYLQCKWCTDHGSNYSLSHRNWKYWSTWATSIAGTSIIHGCSASGGDFFFPVRDVAFRLHFSLIFSIHSLNASVIGFTTMTRIFWRSRCNFYICQRSSTFICRAATIDLLLVVFKKKKAPCAQYDVCRAIMLFQYSLS